MAEVPHGSLTDGMVVQGKGIVGDLGAEIRIGNEFQPVGGLGGGMWPSGRTDSGRRNVPSV